MIRLDSLPCGRNEGGRENFFFEKTMKFATILADPPWSYEVWSTYGAGRSAGYHYPTQDTEWICHLPVADIAEKDCCLLLWATYPKLPDALRVVKAWGFTYKTVAFTWVKLTASRTPRLGLGYWTRSNAEICILATRGNPKRKAKDVEQIIECGIGRHSEKPMEVYGRIECLLDGPFLECFARPKGPLFPYQEGWTQIGNEIDGKDIRDALCELAATKTTSF